MSLIRFETAAEMFDTFPNLREDLSHAPENVPPLAFLDKLQSSETPEDAVTFLAHMLPRRYAVYWACGCVRALEGNADLDSSETMSAALAWLREPEENARLRALAVGMMADRKLSATWLALSAAWSGGSIAPPGHSAVITPPSHLTAVAAKAAVLIALARVGSAMRQENLRRVLDQGRKLATGNERAG